MGGRAVDQDELAYKLWRQSKRMEDLGDLETGGSATGYYGQSIGLQRAAFMVLAHGRDGVDVEFFEKRDRARIESLTKPTDKS